MSTTSSVDLQGKPRRDAGIIGLLFASTTSMVGSGWLFGACHASRIAGPLSIGSWVLGAIIIMLIALCFAELAAMFPRSGALVHVSHASHGVGLGRIFGGGLGAVGFGWASCWSRCGAWWCWCSRWAARSMAARRRR
ncbi:hypothetical protein Q3A80_21360 [Burkholderia sp. SR8]|uniref:hypothetical protein n=1 Tax=Burkholderia sp. SR8 TaxID=3062277 RepID=UPI004062D19C